MLEGISVSNCPGTKVRDDFEQLDMGAGNQTNFLTRAVQSS